MELASEDEDGSRTDLLGSLHEWLKRADQLIRSPVELVPRPGPPGDMGSVLVRIVDSEPEVSCELDESVSRLHRLLAIGLPLATVNAVQARLGHLPVEDRNAGVSARWFRLPHQWRYERLRLLLG